MTDKREREREDVSVWESERQRVIQAETLRETLHVWVYVRECAREREKGGVTDLLLCSG